MSSDARNRAREIARPYLDADDPLSWFEALYAASKGDASAIPWANLEPNPNLVAWLDRPPPLDPGLRALVIGCGLGDDAEELDRRGCRTTAFDISPTAIEWCRRRFPKSRVSYAVADLLDTPPSWKAGFDLVVESYTLQALPSGIRPRALAQTASLVAPGGRLLVITRGRDEGDPEGELPWPLTRRELDALLELGLAPVRFEDYVDPEDPPVRRLRAEYRRR